MLNMMLCTAFTEVPAVQKSEDFRLPGAPMLPACLASPLAAPAPQAPPALRKRSLPPPPEVPAELLASLRPSKRAASASHTASLGPPSSASCSCSAAPEDTAASSQPDIIHPALQQAISWLTRRG